MLEQKQSECNTSADPSLPLKKSEKKKKCMYTEKNYILEVMEYYFLFFETNWDACIFTHEVIWNVTV